MSREEEYKRKCRQVKDYYLEEICEHEDAGCSRGIRWGALSTITIGEHGGNHGYG